MFFYLSKILQFLFDPINWVLILIIFGLIKSKKFIIWLSVIILILFSNSFILDELLRLWEPKAIEIKEGEKYKYAILLAGMISYDSQFNRINFDGSVDRLLQTMQLLAEKKIENVIITSGSGSIVYSDMKEADLLKQYLVKLGFDSTKIITESNSKNTYENAVFTKKMLDSLNIDTNQKFLLISSAMHLRRGEACFKKQGIKVQVYAVDRASGPRKFVFDHLIVPQTNVLKSWIHFNHEIIGYITYYLMNYI